MPVSDAKHAKTKKAHKKQKNNFRASKAKCTRRNQTIATQDGNLTILRDQATVLHNIIDERNTTITGNNATMNTQATTLQNNQTTMNNQTNALNANQTTMDAQADTLAANQVTITGQANTLAANQVTISGQAAIIVIRDATIVTQAKIIDENRTDINELKDRMGRVEIDRGCPAGPIAPAAVNNDSD